MIYIMLLLTMCNALQGMASDPSKSDQPTSTLPAPFQSTPLSWVIDECGNQFIFNPQFKIYAPVIRMPQSVQMCERCKQINFSSDGDIIVDGILLVAHDLHNFKSMRERLDHIIRLQALIHKERKEQRVNKTRIHLWRSYASLFNLNTIREDLKKKESKTLEEQALSTALRILFHCLNDNDQQGV